MPYVPPPGNQSNARPGSPASRYTDKSRLPSPGQRASVVYESRRLKTERCRYHSHHHACPAPTLPESASTRSVARRLSPPASPRSGHAVSTPRSLPSVRTSHCLSSLGESAGAARVSSVTAPPSHPMIAAASRSQSGSSVSCSAPASPTSSPKSAPVSGSGTRSSRANARGPGSSSGGGTCSMPVSPPPPGTARPSLPRASRGLWFEVHSDAPLLCLGTSG